MKKIILYLTLAGIACACGGKPQQEEATSLKEWRPVFEQLELPTAEGSFYPRLAENKEEQELLMSWYTQGEGDTTALYTATYDQTWTEPVKLAEGEHWFVNWADFHNLAAFGEHKAINYLQKNGDGFYSYEVHLKFYEPETGKWSENSMVPHKDNTETEHGFVSMAEMQDEKLGIVWLDGRKYAEAQHTGHDEGGHGGAEEMTLRFAEISKDEKILDKHVLDERTCDCCQTGLAKTKEGLVAVYRDRSEEEIRDIAFTRYENGKWTEPAILHADGWQIKGCPVNGPAIDAREQEVVVAWFTAAEGQNKVKFIRSGDEGKNWQEPVLVDADRPVGRVDVRLLPDNSALVSWLAAENQIKVQRISPEGKSMGSGIVATVEGGRSLGFPQLAYKDGAIYVAWTDTQKPKKVRMVKALL